MQTSSLYGIMSPYVSIKSSSYLTTLFIWSVSGMSQFQVCIDILEDHFTGPYFCPYPLTASPCPLNLSPCPCRRGSSHPRPSSPWPSNLSPCPCPCRWGWSHLRPSSPCPLNLSPCPCRRGWSHPRLTRPCPLNLSPCPRGWSPW